LTDCHQGKALCNHKDGRTTCTARCRFRNYDTCKNYNCRLDFAGPDIERGCGSPQARRLQRRATTLATRMEDAVRICLHLPSAPGSGAALCQGLRASSRRCHRPTGQFKRQERTQNWIKPGGKVNDFDDVAINLQGLRGGARPLQLQRQENIRARRSYRDHDDIGALSGCHR
jgi:hypothetical protein